MADPIIRILLGDQWLAATPLVQIYCGVSALIFPILITQPILIAIGRVREALRINMIMLPITLAMLIVGGLHSLTMVALLGYVTGLCNVIVTLTILRRYVAFSYARLARRVAKSALITLFACAAPVAMILWSGATFDVSVPRFLLAAAGFALLWLAALYVVRHPFRTEIQHILQIDFRRAFRT